MRIVVVGAGGVGGYFGARLASAGHDVVFVARGRHLAAIRESGLEVRSPLGDLRTTAPAVATVAEAGPADLVLVAVKLWDTEEVAAQLKPLGARVMSLQNGVTKDDVLRAHVPPESVLGGVCYISAAIAEPGVVVHHGAMQRLEFGEFDGRPSATTDALLAACAEAGVDAAVSTDIERVIWEKFVFLVGMSATTAAIRAPVGVIREHPRSRALLYDVMAEAVAVGRASGVRLAEEFAAERLAFVDTLPAEMTASMYRDLLAGNRLELPWLSGAVADLGARLGVPNPRNRTIVDVLAPYELGGWFDRSAAVATPGMAMSYTGAVLDAPDARELAGFYQRLLGWRMVEDSPDWVVLQEPEGTAKLSFQTEPEYRPPVWPGRADAQLMMAHVDIAVDDLEAEVARAVAEGAKLAEFQPQEYVRVCLDPAGHPFCLYLPGH